MSTLSGILELSKRALMAHQMVSNIIGNNVANVNTPGYSRQTGVLVPSPSVQSVWGPLGTGVDVARVERHRDAFLDQQYRRSSAEQSRWTALAKSLSEVETVFNDPGDSGLQVTLDEFWDAWSDLADDPENVTARISVREKGVTLTRAFHRMANYLHDHIAAVDREACSLVEEVNSALANVAQLNRQIKTAEGQGGSANELRDQRDRLLDKLAEYVGAQSLESSDGSVRVLIGTSVVVEGTRAQKITAEAAGAGDMTVTQFRDSSGQLLDSRNGKLGGLLEIRDDVLRSYLDDLDKLARTIVHEVNLRHGQGMTLDGEEGGDFFSSQTITAASMKLSSDVLQDARKIVASADENTGNNDVALSIASLRWQKVMSDGTQSLVEFYSGLVGKVGIQTSEALDAEANQELVTQTLETQRQMVQGVSLDEEMAELIKFQHAYAASAQVVSVVDEMTRTVLSMVR